jgi:hypothetical protein
VLKVSWPHMCGFSIPHYWAICWSFFISTLDYHNYFFTGVYCLSRQVLYHLSHASSPFFSGYFGDMVSHFSSRPAWTMILLFKLPTVIGTTRVCHYTQLLSIEMGSHKLFCWGWPGTVILPITASQVSRITGITTSAQLDVYIFHYTQLPYNILKSVPLITFCNDGKFLEFCKL